MIKDFYSHQRQLYLNQQEKLKIDQHVDQPRFVLNYHIVFNYFVLICNLFILSFCFHRFQTGQDDVTELRIPRHRLQLLV